MLFKSYIFRSFDYIVQQIQQKTTLSITYTFVDHQAFVDLLGRVTITPRCVARLIDEEGVKSVRHLSTITIKVLISTIANVDILFDGEIGSQRIYFLFIKVEFITALSVYLQKCITTNQILDICLIDVTRVQEFVESYPSQVEKDNDTRNIVKQNDIKFDHIKFKTFQDQIKTLLCYIRGGRGIIIECIVRDRPDYSGPTEEVDLPSVDSNDIISERATLNVQAFNVIM